MFNKHASWENEILQEMEKSLVKTAANAENQPLKKYASAIDSLNEAAETFDALGMAKEAELTTRLIEVVAGKKKPKKKVDKKLSKSKSKANSKSSKKDSKKSDPATKGLTSEKEVENLKTKGWVFNADDVEILDVNDANDDINDHRLFRDLEFHRQDTPADSEYYEKLAKEVDVMAMNAAREGKTGVARKLFEMAHEYRDQADKVRAKENDSYWNSADDDLGWVFDDEEWGKDEREMDLAGAGMDLEDQERDIAEDLGEDSFDFPAFEPMARKKHRW